MNPTAAKTAPTQRVSRPDGKRGWSTKLGHPVQDVARDRRFGFLGLRISTTHAGGAAFTHQRREILPIQWRQVDMKACIVRLDVGTTKNERGRVLPFGELQELHAALKEQKRLSQDLSRHGVICPWVFNRDGKPIRSFKGAWEVACRAAGCPGRIPHDLRRTAVRNFERAGVPRSIAMQITGHKTESVYRRYDIVDEADLAEGLRRLDRHGHTFGHTPTKKTNSGR